MYMEVFRGISSVLKKKKKKKMCSGWSFGQSVGQSGILSKRALKINYLLVIETIVTVGTITMTVYQQQECHI